MSKYPRVTEILRPFSGYDHVPKDVLDRAAARGTQVHAICAGIAKGAWIPDSMIQEHLMGYITSFKLWFSAQVKSCIIIEQRYKDDDLQYSGQMDMVVVCNDDCMYLIDLKTSSRPQKTYPIQMAAYERLLRCHSIKVSGAMIVYLNKDGEFPDIHKLDDMTEELEVFYSALKCWRYFNKEEKNGRTETKRP
jgi:hypothetical protein